MVAKLFIEGGRALHGEVVIAGAKNAALPIMAASLLATEVVSIENVPWLYDVTTMITLLEQLGVRCNKCCHKTLQIYADKVQDYRLCYELVRTMRAAILMLGPLLSRYGKANISLPGGCAIGPRPVDIHLRGLKSMGASITVEHGYIHAVAKGGLQGTTFEMPIITVTGTENLMMAATLAKGTTVLRRAACEPEIVDLANFLNTLGADIKGAGSSEIVINGVSELSGGHYQILPDRIEAATYLAAAIITGGAVKVKKVDPTTLQAVLTKFSESGARLEITKDSILVDMHNRRPQAVDIITAPYPHFPTDMQAQMIAINTIAKGMGVITETIFENRFMHAQELIRMGANIVLKGQRAYCHGVKQLAGAKVMATDLRACASLVLAGLAANGETIIDHIYHMDRGYETMENKLLALGAKVRRISN